jgi:hypothetical protein
MKNNIKVRELPTKTYIYLCILIVAGILAIFIVKDGKSKKATKVLTQLGYLKVADVSVFKKTEFVNEDTNIRGFQYSLQFKDLTANKICKGWIVRDFKGKVAKDLECKKIGK